MRHPYLVCRKRDLAELALVLQVPLCGTTDPIMVPLMEIYSADDSTFPDDVLAILVETTGERTLFGPPAERMTIIRRDQAALDYLHKELR